MARGNALNWKDLAKKLSGLAPAIGTALAGPAGGAVGMVVANRLGVRPTPEAVINAMRVDPDAEERLREIDREMAQAEMADMQHAREAHKGHWLPPVLTLALISASAGATAALFVSEIPARNEPLIYTAFGALLGWTGTAIAYWIGSSRGSAEKQDTIAKAIQ